MIWACGVAVGSSKNTNQKGREWRNNSRRKVKKIDEGDISDLGIGPEAGGEMGEINSSLFQNKQICNPELFCCWRQESREAFCLWWKNECNLSQNTNTCVGKKNDDSFFVNVLVLLHFSGNIFASHLV